MSFQQVFAVRAAGLELIPPLRLDGRKDIQSVKLAWSILNSDFKAHLQVLLLGIINDVTSAHTEDSLICLQLKEIFENLPQKSL